MEGFVAEARFSLRMLAKNPVVSSICVIALAFGVGSSSALLGIINGVLFRQLPFKDSASVVVLFTKSLQDPQMDEMQVSVPDYLAWSQQSHALESIAGYTWTDYET